jgi:hypothetical protein
LEVENQTAFGFAWSDRHEFNGHKQYDLEVGRIHEQATWPEP